MDLLQATR
ncbi:hypothetical protein Zm00014a_030761 [Zea mays]|uniref:Uncharacterized protein n=1 Tax=Zea mays TaxID=4577 RepID=A0A3L6FRD5_MAIZE|nr:hypothetical protein Zm00014a_030761 [Zea mays]